MLAIQAEEGEGSRHPYESQPPPSTAQPTNEEPIPTVVSSSHQKTQTPRQALKEVTELPQMSVPIPNVTSEPISNVPDKAIFKEWDDRVVRATITAASLDAIQASGNITKTQSTAIPNVPLPRGIGACGSPRCQEAMGVPLLRLGLRGTASSLFSTAEESVSTAGASMPVSTAAMVQEVNISIPSPVVVKDKGKDIMTDSKDEKTKRTKLQQEQDRLGHEAAVRLQEELDEEERQRMARVHAAAQSFTEEEWENIRARVEADEELTQRL
ncbi:hypothetical protein Tco_0624602 [Tanacetum coccineum]|uniref:Uncharacterized protein n=1 Tax=Tanacetum coccineum TaxID=301880 RepID=A0ABQ4WEE6_9ASTR